MCANGNSIKSDAFYKRPLIYFPDSCCAAHVDYANLYYNFAARMLKEKITFTKTFGLILGGAGAALLISNRGVSASGENAPLGDFLVILSAFAYTFYFILVKPLMNKYSAIQVIRWIFTIGFVMTFPLSLKEFTDITWQIFTLKDWLILFVIVVPGTFLAYVFNVYGIQKLSASMAGAYIYSQPVFAVGIAMIFLKEQLSLYKIIAAIFIFAGVYLSNRKKD